jgi:TonB family protein
MREDQGDLAQAEQMYTRAANAAPSDSSDRATALELHARLLRRMGRETEAHLDELQARQIRTKTFAEAAAGSQTSGTVYRIGAGVAPPALIQKVEPEYTDEARMAKYQGTAILSIQVGLDGKAHHLALVRSLGLGLDEKAAEAIRQWTFRPASKDGRPVVVSATVEVNFRLL